MCRGASVGAKITFDDIPWLPGVRELAAAGFVTGASRRNFASYAGDVILAARIGDAERALLSDPQTSGGLLVACASDSLADVLDIFRREGFAAAAPIGCFVAGAPTITVT